MTDADAAIVVLLTALSKDADFDGSDLGIDLRWRSKPGEPQDGRDWQPWGAVDVYLPLAKHALDRAIDRVREREEAEAREHPVLRLASALRSLTNSFANIRLFEQYAIVRDDAVRRHHNSGNEMLRMANNRPRQPGPPGETFEQSLAREVAETAEAGAWMARPPLVNVSVAMLRIMRTDLHLIELHAQRVLRASINGASKRLDGLIAPNAQGQPPSIELLQRVDVAQRLWGKWILILNDTRVQMEGDVEQLRELAAFFGTFTSNLLAAIQTEGLDKPAPPSTVATEALEQVAMRAAAAALAASASEISSPAASTPPSPKVTVAARAIDLLTKHPEYADATSEEWAKRLNCSEKTVRNTDAWRFRNRTQKLRVVSLTNNLQDNLDESGHVGRSIGARPQESELDRLVAEQRKEQAEDVRRERSRKNTRSAQER